MTQVLLRDGLAGRTAAFQAPPTTAYAVMLGYRAELPGFVFPPVAHPAPLDGSSLELANRFGAWYLYGILRRLGASDEAAWASMLDWRGDELSVYQNGDDVVAVWRLRFGDAKHADALGEEINAEGRDAARTAVLLDEEVFVFAAESAEVLLAWAELPLDSMTASIVPKAARHRGGAVSVGDCLKPRALSLPIPPPVSH